MESKICKMCLRELSILEFRIHEGGRLGRRNRCKSCEQIVRIRKRKIARPVALPENSPTDLSWAAGIIEGEGTIGVTRSNPGFGLTVAVVNTDLYMLLKLRDMFGSKIGKHSGSKTSRKAQWRWGVHGKHASAVLRVVVQYMHTTKKRQAELAIQYSERFSNYPGFRNRNTERRTEQEWYYEKMKALKHELPTLETIEV